MVFFRRTMVLIALLLFPLTALAQPGQTASSIPRIVQFSYDAADAGPALRHAVFRELEATGDTFELDQLVEVARLTWWDEAHLVSLRPQENFEPRVFFLRDPSGTLHRLTSETDIRALTARWPAHVDSPGQGETRFDGSYRDNNEHYLAFQLLFGRLLGAPALPVWNADHLDSRSYYLPWTEGLAIPAALAADAFVDFAASRDVADGHVLEASVILFGPAPELTRFRFTLSRNGSIEATRVAEPVGLHPVALAPLQALPRPMPPDPIGTGLLWVSENGLCTLQTQRGRAGRIGGVVLTTNCASSLESLNTGNPHRNVWGNSCAVLEIGDGNIELDCGRGPFEAPFMDGSPDLSQFTGSAFKPQDWSDRCTSLVPLADGDVTPLGGTAAQFPGLVGMRACLAATLRSGEPADAVRLLRAAVMARQAEMTFDLLSAFDPAAEDSVVPGPLPWNANLFDDAILPAPDGAALLEAARALVEDQCAGNPEGMGCPHLYSGHLHAKRSGSP